MQNKRLTQEEVAVDRCQRQLQTLQTPCLSYFFRGPQAPPVISPQLLQCRAEQHRIHSFGNSKNSLTRTISLLQTKEPPPIKHTMIRPLLLLTTRRHSHLLHHPHREHMKSSVRSLIVLQQWLQYSRINSRSK